MLMISMLRYTVEIFIKMCWWPKKKPCGNRRISPSVHILYGWDEDILTCCLFSVSFGLSFFSSSSPFHFIAIQKCVLVRACKWVYERVAFSLVLPFRITVFFRFVNLLSFQKHVINAQIFVLRISNKILFRIFTFRHNVRSLSGPCWPKRFESKIPKRYIGEKHIERWIRSS